MSRIAVAILAVAAVRLAGATLATDDALQVMGFDPDRARLIVALIVGALAASIVSILGGGRLVASLTGLVASAAWFGRFFVEETNRAWQTSGATGTFDPAGWALTLLTLVVTAIAVSWAAAVLAREARVAILAAIAALDLRRHLGALPEAEPGRPAAGRPDASGWRRAGPVVRVLAVAGIAAVTLPILGDMFNFDPDVHMQSGGLSRVGLVGGDAAGASSAPSAGDATPAASPVSGAHNVAGSSNTTASGPAPSDAPASGVPSSFPADLVPGPIKNTLVTAGALGAANWGPAPRGAGRIVTVHLHAPWTGGTSSSAVLEIYLPPGYDTSKARYPVYYEAPSSIGSWQNGMSFSNAMDVLMTSGTLPPAIVVFASESGGPYVDAECADTYDGKEWFNRFMATTVVNWVDTNLRSIARPQARVNLGFSQGGYCSAAILARHPDVFRTSISMSGYFQAGVKSGTTPTAWRPFNNDPTLMAAASPIDLVPALPEAVRSGLMVIMEADPGNKFYGAQAMAYASALDRAGVAIGVLPDPRGHSWDAARPDIPAMMLLAALRMAHLGVFG